MFLRVCVSFLLKQPTLLLNHFALSMAIEAAKAAIGGDDTMARDIRSKRVATQGLTDRLCTTAAYAAGQFSIGDGLAGGDIQQFEVDTTLEVGDLSRSQDLGSYFGCCHNPKTASVQTMYQG